LTYSAWETTGAKSVNDATIKVNFDIRLRFSMIGSPTRL
jgi:hypothetical protein